MFYFPEIFSVPFQMEVFYPNKSVNTTLFFQIIQIFIKYLTIKKVESINFQWDNERKTKMKVYYDAEVDAIYIKLGKQKPDGVVEISDGVNLDTTSEDKIVGIEILQASQKMNIKTILSYELELDKKLTHKTA